MTLFALVAELVDAAALKAASHMGVRVRVPPGALCLNRLNDYYVSFKCIILDPLMLNMSTEL